MSPPLGWLCLTGWVDTDPLGRDLPYLLLTTNGKEGSPRDSRAMRRVAALMGMRVGAVRRDAIPGLYVSLEGTDVALHTPEGGSFTRPVYGEWLGVAQQRREALLMIGLDTMPSDADVVEIELYVSTALDTVRFAAGLIPVRT